MESSGRPVRRREAKILRPPFTAVRLPYPVYGGVVVYTQPSVLRDRQPTLPSQTSNVLAPKPLRNYDVIDCLCPDERERERLAGSSALPSVPIPFLILPFVLIRLNRYWLTSWRMCVCVCVCFLVAAFRLSKWNDCMGGVGCTGDDICFQRDGVDKWRLALVMISPYEWSSLSVLSFGWGLSV